MGTNTDGVRDADDVVLDLFATLIDIIRLSRDSTRAKAVLVLRNLAFHREGKILFLSDGTPHVAKGGGGGSCVLR